jgi:hypothetical protein
MAPTDGSLSAEARTSPVRARAVARPAPAAEAAAPPPAESGAPAQAPPDEPWMPPNWSGATGRGPAAGAASGSARGARGRRWSEQDAASELAKVRHSYSEVLKERDSLKLHVRKMEELIKEQVASKFRSRSAPPTRALVSDAMGGAGVGGAEVKAKRLSKEAEAEMMRRLVGRAWKPSRDAKGSGVEQLKRRLEGEERKQLEAAKAKCKVYNTKAEVEAAAEEMFKRDMQRRAKLLEDCKKRREAQAVTTPRSKTSQYMRDVRFAQLSLPVRKPPKMPARPGAGAKPAWGAGPGVASSNGGSGSRGALGEGSSSRSKIDYDVARAVH